jgi:hypothetical protein
LLDRGDTRAPSATLANRFGNITANASRSAAMINA